MYKSIKEMGYGDVIHRLAQFYKAPEEAYRLLTNHFPERYYSKPDGSVDIGLSEFFEAEAEAYRKYAQAYAGCRREVAVLKCALDTVSAKSIPASAPLPINLDMIEESYSDGRH